MSLDKSHSEQFERYLKGLMSPEETHTFEREVLDDPFAMEALEGYEGQGVATIEDLQKLKSKVLKKEKTQIPFIRIAAVVALLIIGSFTVYTFTNQLEDNELAMEEEPLEESLQNIPTPDASSIPKLKPSKIEKEIAEDVKTETGTKDGLKVASKDDEVVQLAVENDEEPKDEIAASSLMDETTTLSTREEELVIAETETHEVQATQGEASNHLQKRVPNLSTTESDQVALMQVEEEEDIIKSSNTEPISKFSSASRGAASMKANFTPARPINGEKAFDEYLKGNLIYPESAKENGIEGTVELAIEIDSTGNISNISIKKSLGYGCDEEAIRLINEGPKWNAAVKENKSIGDTKRLSVSFKLED